MPVTDIHVSRDKRLGAEFDPRAELCLAAVLEQPDIQFLVHVYLRHLNLAVDRLADDGHRDQRRESHRQIARAVADEIRALDHVLQDFRTGPLIRLVLHGPGGAVFANSVLLDEFVMATMPLPSGTQQPDAALSQRGSVPRVDKAVATLVDRIRALVGQPSLNPGGWFPNPPDSEHPKDIPADVLHEEIMRADGAESLAAFRAPVASGTVQYVALFQGTSQILEVDAFESQAVRQFLTRIPPENRRRLYRDFGREAEGQVAELARLSSAATASPLLRVVFDVEQGAIIYYRVGDDRHLIAVTLDQSAVSRADEVVGNLVLTCQ